MLNYTISRHRGKFVLIEKDSEGNITETLYERACKLFISLQDRLQFRQLEKVTIRVVESKIVPSQHNVSLYTINNSVRELASSIKREHNKFIYA